MAVCNLFSKRHKKLKGEVPDVYQYDNIPRPLRVQIVHIMHDAMGNVHSRHTENIFQLIHDILCREYGKFSLSDDVYVRGIDHDNDVLKFLINSNDVEQVLDVVELSFKAIDTYYRKENFRHFTQSKITPDEAIEELNIRFREQGVGYQYESGESLIQTSCA
ncbi:MAG: hypothetical protein RIB93_29350 [Coleofasciculus sp. D1-CHI-01]|uniref:STM4504/CBY_0614 family protein n=1 Tax=Coleofasciculus sp. D1-CHI-01 TaxID=3068482 RepID=UPI0032F8E1D5